jgi:tetratricopeptide (TPR) repeat protein
MWNRNLVAAEAPIMAEIWESLECTHKAIQLDPELPMAHNNLGMYAMFYDWDWARAEREFKAAIAGQHVGAEYNLSTLYLATGRRAEADAHQRRARDKDPIGNPAMANTAAFLFLEGRFAESTDHVLKLAQQSPGNPLWQARIAAAGIWLGKADEAIVALRRIPQPSWYVKGFLASAEALVGHRDEALGIIRSIEESNYDGRIQNFSFAAMYASVDDEANTVKYLEQAVNLHELPAIYIHVHPDFAKWQNTPEFHRLKKRMGLDW